MMRLREIINRYPAFTALWPSESALTTALVRYRQQAGGLGPGIGGRVDYSLEELRAAALLRLVDLSDLGFAAATAEWRIEDNSDPVAVLRVGRCRLTVEVPPALWAELTDDLAVPS